MEELRWPTMFEYDGVKWQREQASQQGAKAAQQNNPLLAIQQPRRAAARRPKTFGGLVAQTVGKAVIDALKDTQEAWLSDAEWAATMHKKLAMNLVGPVPRMT